MPLILALPVAGAFGALFFRVNARNAEAWLAGTCALAAFAIVLGYAPQMSRGETVRLAFDWMPSLGLAFSLRMDGFAWMFSLMVTGIGFLVVLYARYYMSARDPVPRFFAFLLGFMASMLGVVLAGNLIQLVLFWELTSLFSFLLIGYWHHNPAARDGARMALIVTSAGGLALFAGALLVGRIVGSYDLDAVLASGDLIRSHALYVPAMTLVVIAALTKSAQFPFHFWLPHAMAAPTPVSAYLHSATMVKAGVFLLARLYPALGGTDPWFWIVSLTGLATLSIGAYLALFEHDLKGLLAYSTISHLGLITLLFGLDAPLGVVAGVFHILNHAAFKASLFMAAGIIDHETGTRDMRKLNGLWKHMPWTGALAMVAAGAMAGVPLLNGFLSKEMFFGVALARHDDTVLEWLLPAGAVVAAMFSVAYSMRFIHDVFFNGEPVGLTRVPHEPPRFMRVPVEILVVVCLVVGLLPALSVGPLLAVGAQAALFGGSEGVLPEYRLAIWHGFNLALAMSALALAGGVALYFELQRRVNLHRLERAPATPNTGGRDLFVLALARARTLALRVTGELQNDSLQRYLLVLVAFALAAGALPFVQGGTQAGVVAPDGPPVGFGFAVAWSIGVAATLATLRFHERRLPALVLLGAVGLMVSLAFAYFSAPDLALTQLLVEVATIILMMLALHWLPAGSNPATRGSRLRRGRDALVAIAAGGGIAALTWAVLARPFDPISPYFLATTSALGGGANAVNVILVDYRAFDTLGEITVLGVAALVVHALLAGFRPGDAAAAPQHDDSHPLMLALIVPLLLPLATMVSVFLFLRGHNLPGGGFSAGLVLAIALVMQFVANGQRFVAARMRTDYLPWIGGGLLVAGATGIGSWFFGAPFLTSTYDYPVWPGVGAVPLASAALFDLGVFLTVVGTTMTALVAMSRLSVDGAWGRQP